MGARFSAPVQIGPGAHPASCTKGTGSLPGVKSSRGVALTPHHFLVPWSRKGRAIPLLPLWAIRPVQSLSACTRVKFNPFTLYYLPCQSPLINIRAAFGHNEKLCNMLHRVVLCLVLLSQLMFIMSLNILITGHSNGHTHFCVRYNISFIGVIQRLSVLLDSSCCIYIVRYDILSLSPFYRKN